MALGTSETVDWDEVIKSGFYGMITAGILNGGNMIINGATVTVDSILKHIEGRFDNKFHLHMELNLIYDL